MQLSTLLGQAANGLGAFASGLCLTITASAFLFAAEAQAAPAPGPAGDGPALRVIQDAGTPAGPAASRPQ